MNTFVPADYHDMIAEMKESNGIILSKLRALGYKIEDYPQLAGKGQSKGKAAARAFPIQGILKYHGMADWEWRTTYLPSISVNNDAAYTTTYLEFDPALETDIVVINSQEALGRDLERVTKSLDVFRKFAGISSNAKVVSRNVVQTSKTGKGLGTSAAASAALATAAIAALFGNEAVQNFRFLSTMSRLLAGSGCRSAVGGIGLWLSYPSISPEDSFAIRLDNNNELADVSLITIPIDSSIGLKTEEAHKDATNSIFYKPWMKSRKDEIIDIIEGVRRGDWKRIGQYAEVDSIRLHGITMSGNFENKVFAWEPENIVLFRMCNELRSENIPVYFSTDTGPTTVFITHKQYEDRVIDKINSLNMGFEIVRGSLAGPAHIVDLDTAETDLGAL